jgi:hypothetical protein
MQTRSSGGQQKNKKYLTESEVKDIKKKKGLYYRLVPPLHRKGGY